jgi:Transglycosylase SLT domain
VSIRFPRAALAGALLLIAPALARAREVVVPLQLDDAFLRQALLTQVYTGPEHTVRVWDDGSGCNFLILSDPQVDAATGRLRIRSGGKARVGTPVGTRCLTVLDWSGTVEVEEEPALDPALPIVRFHVVDSNLCGADGKKRVTGTLWDWTKAYVHPRLEAVTIDLNQPLTELRAFLPLVLPSESAEQTTHLLDSIALARPRMVETGLTIDLHIDVAEAAAAAPTAPAPEPTLTEDEVARWEAAWQRWDAFLTFVSKQAATDTAAAAQRQALFDVLIDARYDILWVLRPSSANEPDPVPGLFVKTWTRLAPVLRDLSLGLPGEGALRYLAFIAAADALRAINDLGPASGLDISADGLRRLARMIAPATAEDPVAYSDAVDPALRDVFGFGAPLPAAVDNPDVDLSWWMPARAWAASDISRLNRWVPTLDDLGEYLPLVQDLLEQTASRTLAKQTLDQQFHQLYHWLVLATAWKESCWRQFVRAGERIKPILSPVGAVGIMQVNQRVWRGFYDPKGLSQDISYNAMAGAEILLRYLRDYAIAKGEHTVTGDVDNLARATYAVYNGGPGHLTRYRTRSGDKGLRMIDESFWDKYRKIKSGQVLAVAECYGP